MLNSGNLVGLNQKYQPFRLKYSTILYTNTETMLGDLKLSWNPKPKYVQPFFTKAKVSVIQMKYITMLHRYLQATYPKQANTKFAGGLMLIQLAKELYDMHSLRLPF